MLMQVMACPNLFLETGSDTSKLTERDLNAIATIAVKGFTA
jgi:hypothetical protein